MTVVSNLWNLATRNLRQSGILVAFVAIVIFFAVLNPNFLAPGNLTNIVLQYSYILVLAIGMVIVIIAGHIDLSVGSVVALTGAVAAVVVIRMDMPWWAGVLAALVVGIIVGAWQGFWVAFVGIPAFIVTLAGMLLFRGLTYLVLGSISLSPFGGTYYQIANGFLNSMFGTVDLGSYAVGFAGLTFEVAIKFDVFTVAIFAIGVIGYAVWQIRRRRAKFAYQQAVESMPLFVLKIVAVAVVVMWFGFQLAASRGLPYVLIILAALIIAYTLLTQKTVFGRHVYAIGGNLNAAILSGVKVRKVNFWIFVNMGMLAAVAGVLFSARTNGAQPGAGNMFELDAIAACFIGGAAVTGGVGRVGGAIIGGLIMAVMSNGMQLMGVDQPTQQVVKGLVLLVAVAFDVWNKKRAARAA
ncbi:MAG: multiple monosaccharide ABC transporter permease [Microbacterium sp.]|uniref:multiple monosaccharide ABC transporter permease n=1 Tax=Microbacterium sp. TaxID=51671 RepID=UPI003BB1CCA1